MHLTYLIDSDNFAIKIYSDDRPEPIIYQPDWPNGTAWSSAAEAESWAQLCIQAITDENAPYAPAGPGLAGEPKNYYLNEYNTTN